jgi:hypothetical protein
MRWIITVALLLAGITCIAPNVWCSDQEQGFRTVGVRGGFEATSRNIEFHQYEVYTSYGLPWSIRADSGWGVAMQANASAGALRGDGETGFIGTLGPGLIFDKPGGGPALDLGGDLCFLDRYKFGSVNLNGNPLFEGHLGVAWRFSGGPGVSYRFQHMSNGGLGLHGSGNTGLDMHMFGVSWNF